MGLVRMTLWTLGGLIVGALVGFGIAYLIWTLDGQPSKGDAWAGLAALILVCTSAFGTLVGAHNGSE